MHNTSRVPVGAYYVALAVPIVDRKLPQQHISVLWHQAVQIRGAPIASRVAMARVDEATLDTTLSCEPHCGEPRWSRITGRADTIVPSLPAQEYVTDFTNVMIGKL